MIARLGGNVVAVFCLLAPFLGAYLAVHFSNNNWLLLAAPAIIYMESGLVLIGAALAIVAIFGKGF